MTVVLQQWIPKPAFLPVNYLRPIVVTGISENPAGVMFRFDNEQAGFRYQYVVYLCCPVFRWDGDIVDQRMEPVEVCQPVCHHCLAHISIEQQSPSYHYSDNQADKKAQDADHEIPLVKTFKNRGASINVIKRTDFTQSAPKTPQVIGPTENQVPSSIARSSSRLEPENQCSTAFPD